VYLWEEMHLVGRILPSCILPKAGHGRPYHRSAGRFSVAPTHQAFDPEIQNGPSQRMSG
jgi:hypothetical protein